MRTYNGRAGILVSGLGRDKVCALATLGYAGPVGFEEVGVLAKTSVVVGGLTPRAIGQPPEAHRSAG